MDAGRQHQYHHHLQHQQMSSVHIDTGGDRFPQWSIQETRDFLMIRGELDPTFMETKRNKPLWEVIATKMKDKAHNRSADQCKCKWKNLVTRYKGCETMEAEGVKQQFPFYNELQAIFAARMQRMVWNEAEESGAGGSSKKKTAQLSSDDEDEKIEESDGDQRGTTTGKKKKMSNKNNPRSSNAGGGNVNSIKEMLEAFMKQQAQMEMQWMNAYETREDERKMREIEWRQRMEAMENERIMMERSCRERGEQRRVREEARAEKRDALITALLNKLRREDSNT